MIIKLALIFLCVPLVTGDVTYQKAKEVAESFIANFTQAVRTSDKETIDKMIGDGFKFSSCLWIRNKADSVQQLSHFENPENFSISIRQVEAWKDSSIRIAVDSESMFPLSSEFYGNILLKLEPLNRTYVLTAGKIRDCSYGSKEVANSYIANMTEAIKSRDVKNIEALITEHFYIVWCNKELLRHELAAVLVKLPDTTTYEVHSVMARDKTKDSIRVDITLTTGTNHTNAAFYVNRADDGYYRMGRADILNCLHID